MMIMITTMTNMQALLITIIIMTMMTNNDDKHVGNPHEPLRKQLVSHSLQHRPASSSCLQVTIHHDYDHDNDDDLYMMMMMTCLQVRAVLLPI